MLYYSNVQGLFVQKIFEAYNQTIINFISLKNENKNSEDDSDDSNNLQEPHSSDDDVTVDGVFLRITKKTCMQQLFRLFSWNM